MGRGDWHSQHPIFSLTTMLKLSPLRSEREPTTFRVSSRLSDSGSLLTLDFKYTVSLPDYDV
jgi:hypothetical protein